MINQQIIDKLVVLTLLCICGFPDTASTQEKTTPAQDSASGNYKLSITVDGLKRHYVTHVPKNYDQKRNWPVVIMFHGGGGTAKGVIRDTGWMQKADKEGFLAVFPEGTSPHPSRLGQFRINPQTWNDGSNRQRVGATKRNIADVKFVSAMLDDLNARYSVDNRRIYATGFSNGASMTFRIARELSKVIAATAPVAGVDWMENKPERPVPLLYITGTADPLNPISGGQIFIGRRSFGKKPVIREMIDGWVKLHDCSEKPRLVYHKDGVKGIAYSRPDEVASVVFYTLDGHGHHWPGGKSRLPEKLVGKNVTKLKATDVIWEFFKAHSLPVRGEESTK